MSNMKRSDPEFVRATKVQERFAISKTTLYRWAKEGRIKIYKHGAMSLVSVSDLRSVITAGSDG